MDGGEAPPAIVTDAERRLDDANIQLGHELSMIHSGLAVYRIIGLNAASIRRAPGGTFLGFVQRESLVTVALGLGKVFEREGKTYELSSVLGVYRLAKAVPIQNKAAADSFVAHCGVPPSPDWQRDVDDVLTNQRTRIQEQMQVIDRVRNTRLAHMEQAAPELSLPSIAAFEELLAFAVDFQSFIGAAFLRVNVHAILTDARVETSLLRALELLLGRAADAKFPVDGPR